MKDLVVGQALGRYELLLPIAKGGMAQVWAARLRGTRGFQKIVALKTILAGAMDDERMEKMFLEEATLASQIHHPNVVGTLELGEENGTLYLVMEWVDGESLNLVINRATARGGIPLPIAVNLIGQACKGLHAAHELRDESGALLGVVHRDISAQNILVAYSGTAKVVDFGIAKATARSSGLTEAGEIKGKFAYLAPEQALAQAVDRRTDIFGMGILLYYVTTGRHPFKGTSPGETLQKIVTGWAPTAPSDIVPGYPVELEAVVKKALNKNPNDRFATAHDMLSALERAMPQCLDGSFESKVAEYMSQLLGNRSRERRTELRLALQMLDARAAGMPMEGLTSSSGSLRALSFDPGGKPSEGSISLSKAAPVAPVPSEPVEEPSITRRMFRRYKVAGSVAISGTFLLLSILRPWARGGDAQRAAGASSNVPATASDATVLAPAAPVVPTPTAAPAPAPAASGSIASDVLDTAPSKRGRKAGPVAPRASATPGAPPAPSPAPPAPERPREAAPTNAWDPGSFGGRR